METKQFIEDAVKGGFAIQQSFYARPVKFQKVRSVNSQYVVFEIDDTTVIEEDGIEKTVPVTTTHQTSQILLDPIAWQAVGRTRGWDKKPFDNPNWPTKKGWEGMWYIFIFSLTLGTSIEEALAAIK